MWRGLARDQLCGLWGQGSRPANGRRPGWEADQWGEARWEEGRGQVLLGKIRGQGRRGRDQRPLHHLQTEPADGRQTGRPGERREEGRAEIYWAFAEMLSGKTASCGVHLTFLSLTPWKSSDWTQITNAMSHCTGQTPSGGIPQIKLDGVGPVDNRPSTDNHFVWRRRKKKTSQELRIAALRVVGWQGVEVITKKMSL